MLERSDPTKLGFDPARLNRIDQMMDRYVAEQKTAGMVTLVSRHGKIIHFGARGYQDVAAEIAMQADTIFRIYSMTKAITSVALMTLLEQGKFHLDDRVHRWIPALKSAKVYGENGALKPINTPITIRQLLTHTAGFSYGFDPEKHPVDAMYADIFRKNKDTKTLAELVELVLEIPLIAQPGSRWHYSVATDLCGYLIELISDMRLGEYLKQTIFDPLNMPDTGFELPKNKVHRFATLYTSTEDTPLVPLENNAESLYIAPVKTESGGSGLVSTTQDYWHFAQMMLNGGEFSGHRVLSPKTVEWMTMNHLPQNLLPLDFNGIVPGPMSGYGFGLGYCVTTNLAKTGTLGSIGDYGWGGLADTYCWSDPKEQLVGILMQQHTPSLIHPGRRDFRNAVYQALVAD